MIISIVGAGRSSYFAIEYLHRIGKKHNWQIHVYDANPNTVSEAIKELCTVNPVNIMSTASSFIAEQSDIVLSLLPAHLHIILARWCVEHGTHFVNSSFVTDEMLELQNAVKVKRLIFLNEMGLDPGIDHMSTCQVIDEIKQKGGKITAVESYCGGLIALENCTHNPWQYKFAWSPRNVILAGQSGTSLYKQNGYTRAMQWHQLFANSKSIDLNGFGEFDAYPNRDSLKYIELYHIPEVKTLIRGTLRRKGFCAAWHKLVEWGFTDNSTEFDQIDSMHTLSKILTGFDFSEKEWQHNLTEDTIKKIDFLDLGNKTSMEITKGTPADFLHELLLQKWNMDEQDQDESILYHKVSFDLNNEQKHVTSTLVQRGNNKNLTAMAKLVGLPAAMGVELIATNQINIYGVQIPNNAQWYAPILQLLKKEGIEINHKNQ